jgi:hypothetical protein
MPPLWPTHIGEKRTTLGKSYGIKAYSVSGNILGNTLQTLRTFWQSHFELKSNVTFQAIEITFVLE